MLKYTSGLCYTGYLLTYVEIQSTFDITVDEALSKAPEWGSDDCMSITSLKILPSAPMLTSAPS